MVTNKVMSYTDYTVTPCILQHIFVYDRQCIRDDHLILGGGLALFGNKYSEHENAGNK